MQATQESTAIQNSMDYNDPKHRNWSLSWASFGLAWIPVSPWKKLDVVINWSEMKNIRPGYRLKVFRGNAPDAFQDDYIPFGFSSRIIELSVFDHPIDIIFTNDLSTIMVGYKFGGGYVDILLANGFKIKNSNPGYPAQFQLVIIN